VSAAGLSQLKSGPRLTQAVQTNVARGRTASFIGLAITSAQ